MTIGTPRESNPFVRYKAPQCPQGAPGRGGGGGGGGSGGYFNRLVCTHTYTHYLNIHEKVHLHRRSLYVRKNTTMITHTDTDTHTPLYMYTDTGSD